MKTNTDLQKRYAPSHRISVRYHESELEILDKRRKKLKRSDYIRLKTVQ